MIRIEAHFASLNGMYVCCLYRKLKKKKHTRTHRKIRKRNRKSFKKTKKVNQLSKFDKQKFEIGTNCF